MTWLRRSALVVIGSLLASLQSPAFAVVKQGGGCTRIGQTVKVNKVIFRCTKVGKKAVWKRVSVPTPAPTPSPSPAPSSTPTASDLVGQRIQAFVEQLSIIHTEAPFRIHWVREPGDDGVFEQAQRESLTRAVDFLTAIDAIPKINDLYIFSGRSQSWFQTTSDSYCPGFQPPQRGGTASKCRGFSDRAAIRINLAGIVTGNYDKVDPSVKLSEYQVDFYNDNWTCAFPSSQSKRCVSYTRWLNVYATIPHELFHVYQFDGPFKAPSWLIEGSAVAVQQFGDVAQMAPRVKYEDHVKRVLVGYRGGDAEASQCSSSLLSMAGVIGKGCQYTQGAQAVETLVALHGGIDVLKKLLMTDLSVDFSSEFQRIVGVSFEQFVAEADAHSRTFGYAAATR